MNRSYSARKNPLRSCAACWFAFLLAAGAVHLHAEQDGPAVEPSQMLQALRTLREQQEVQNKAARQSLLQQIAPAASSADRAVALWEDAVRAVRFDGREKESATFREWKEREGAALSENEAKNAARLYFTWLGLTMRRSAGVTVRELMPAALSYAQELVADQAAMDELEERIKRERDQNDKHGSGKHRVEGDLVRKMHDDILNKPLGGSVVVQWMRLAEVVAVEKWELTPGSLDGIYSKVILPEMRATRDPRLIEYWDARMAREAARATRGRLAFEVEKYNQERGPALRWSRAEDLELLGRKNSAIAEMFALVKAYPAHPDAPGWIDKLEQMLQPPSSASPVAPASNPAR